MDGSRFDALTRGLAAATSRRSIVRGLIGGGVALAMAPAKKTLAAPPKKFSICHRTSDRSNPYLLLSLPEPALAKHYAHGDFEPYDCGGEWSCFEAKPLFNCGPGYDCPTGATTFCPGGPLDPTSSDQALAACEACFGAGECVLITSDCSGNSWTVDFAPESEPLGEPAFGFEIGLCNPDNPQPPGRVYFAAGSDPVSDYGYWGIADCP